MKNQIKALFLDRDGVINEDFAYVHKIADFKFMPNIFKLCEFFEKKNYKIFVITNQSGIARGYYSENDFEILSKFMLSEFEKKGIKISKVYHCPHLGNCECRKPKAGMILKAKSEFNIDLKNSVFIGDNFSDMGAGVAANIGNLGLLRDGSLSQNELDDANLKFNLNLKLSDFMLFKNLKEALEYYKKGYK